MEKTQTISVSEESREKKELEKIRDDREVHLALVALTAFTTGNGKRVVDRKAVAMAHEAVALIELACRYHGSETFTSTGLSASDGLEQAIACGRSMLDG